MEFYDDDLEKLESDPRSTAGKGDAVDRGFRKVMFVIRAAPDERDFYQLRSLHYEKLKGKRSRQSSFRINKQWRLIVEIEETESYKRVGVIGIEDYH